MKRLNLPLVLDTLFAGTCAFLLFFTAVRFYTKSAAWGLVFGIAALFLFGALACVYISGRQNKKLILTRDDRDRKLLALHLSLSSDGYIKRLFLKLFGEDAKPSGQKIVCGNEARFFAFRMQPLTEDDVARVIKYRFEGEKRIYCVKSSPEARALADGFSVKIAEIGEIYAALKEKGLLPEKYNYYGEGKKSFLQLIRSGFTRKLCAPLFWSGAGLLALSYFTFFPIYYIVSGSLLLILSAVALVANQK